MTDLWMRFPGGVLKTLTLSYDDGVEQDARLLSIMNQNGLKGAFNLNGGLFAPEGTVYPAGRIHRRMTERAAVALLAESGQEIALHGYAHGDHPALPPAFAVWQIVKDKETLESTFQRIIRGMAYPYGTFEPAFTQAMKDSGVAYARTTQATHCFDLPHDWLTLHPTCHHADPQLMKLARAFAEEPACRAQMFYLWGHSYEFEADNNWHVIEEFAQYMGGREDIWYATNIQIHDYIEAWRGVHISANGCRLYNPGVIPLWFAADGKVYCLEGGKEIAL